MKKIFLVLFLLPLFLFSQNTKTFTYGIKSIENKDSKMEEMITSISPNFRNLITDVQYNLVVKKDSSCFQINKKTIPDDSGAKWFLARAGSNGKIFQTKDSIFEEVNLEHYNKNYIVKDTLTSSWEFYNEQKNIMGYNCYKAVYVKVVVNEYGTFKSDIIAWYCPELPYQFGPIGYGKLPGLIFELQTKNALFGLIKINLDSQDQLCQMNKKTEFVTNSQLEENILKSRDNDKRMRAKK